MINQLLDKLEVKYPKNVIQIQSNFINMPIYISDVGLKSKREVEYSLWIGSTKCITTKSFDILVNHINQLMDADEDTIAQAEKVLK